jgi:transcriptional regulator with XRE-family HTH domain
MEPSDEQAQSLVATLAAELRELRRAAGSPSYAELARKTGVPRSTLHDGLTGRRLPSLETTLAVAAVCGGDSVEWKRRWMAARASVEEPGTALASPAAAPSSDAVPSSDAAPSSGGRRWSRSAIVVASVVVLIAVGITAAVLVRSSAACSPVREYQVDSAGAVLSGTGATIGDIVAGDTVEVTSLSHDRYPHRYLGTVRRTGVHGYVDEARLTFVAETCA